MSRVTIIAEVGVNHNGDLGRAKQMVWAAKRAGADIVKFQAFTTETIVSRAAPTASYQAANTGLESQFDLIRALELSPADFEVLAGECRAAGIEFLATPFDWTMTSDLVRLGMKALKVASGELTNTPALEHFASFGLPVWLSTGMATLEEVRAALSVLRDAGARNVTVLHCTSLYPAPVDALNLSALTTMANELAVPVGYSDHSLGYHASIAAVVLGAILIEKHFTLDKSLPGPDHIASLDTNEFAQMVGHIREIERMLGDGVKRPVVEELDVAALVRRSWHAKSDLAAGQTVQAEDLLLLRPASGLPPSQCPIGRRLSRKVAAGSPIRVSDLV
jgi:sialic acid synthase SpsE